MLSNIFGGSGDNDIFVILIVLFLLGGFGGCGDKCGGIFDGDNIIWILILLLFLWDSDDCGCR